MPTIDKAGKQHWEKVWTDRPLPSPIDPHNASVRNYASRRLHRFFVEVIGQISPPPHKIIELGCAESQWLPYFSREFGLEASGLDYLEMGCESCREIMRRAGLDTSGIVCADLFEPPPSLLGKFDVVYSSGLVEHFEDTAACVAACARFAKPGGTIVTLIPNMRGLPGFLQKTLNRPVFDKHVPLDLKALAEAHRRAGLHECISQYLVPFNFWVVNLNDWPHWARKVTFAFGGGLTLALGVLHEMGLPLRPNRITSPLIACVFKKPQ